MFVSRLFAISLLFSGSLALGATPSILIERQQAGAFFQQKNWAAAESAYYRLSVKSPNDGAIWHNLGAVRMNLKKYPEAIVAFEQSLITGRRPHECFYNIACSQAMMGETEQSLATLTKAFAYGYSVISEQIQSDPDLLPLHAIPAFRVLIGWPDTSLTNRDKRWQLDIDFFERRIREIHWRPFGAISESEYRARILAIRQSVPKCNDLELRLKIQELMAMLGDGHSMVSPDLFRIMHGAGHGEANPFKLLPIECFLFGSDVRIVAADTSQRKLLGAKIVKVEGRPIEAVLQQIKPLVSSDNIWGAKWALMLQLVDPRVLQALGIGDTIGGVRFTCQTVNESSPREFLVPVTSTLPVKTRLEEQSGSVSRTLSLEPARKLGMVSIGQALYVKIDQTSDEQAESFADFTARIFTTAEEKKSSVLILDLRRNNGGQGHLTRELLHRLISSQEFNQPGKLYVLVGRNTFSAAMAFASQLKLHTSALLVGEPTGSRPNFVGESTVIRLPYSEMFISIASRFHQNGETNDTRLWLPPDIPVPPNFDDQRKGYDRALETILETISE